jgi:hypothetical protein
MLILHVLPPVFHKTRQARKTRLRTEEHREHRQTPLHLKIHRSIQDQVPVGHRITKGQGHRVQPVAARIRTLQIIRQASRVHQVRQVRRAGRVRQVQQVRQAGQVRRVHQVTAHQAGRVHQVQVARQAGHPARQAHPVVVHVQAAEVVDKLVIIN